MNKAGVLFLCTHNSVRSQMAESLLREYAGARFDVYSAGLDPTEVHPLTLQVLREMGLETASLRAKDTREFLGKVSIRYAIIVCDKAAEAEACPRLFPFALQELYWPFEDPAAFEGTPDARLEKFRGVRGQIANRLRTWVLEESRRRLPGASQ